MGSAADIDAGGHFHFTSEPDFSRVTRSANSRLPRCKRINRGRNLRATAKIAASAPNLQFHPGDTG